MTSTPDAAIDAEHVRKIALLSGLDPDDATIAQYQRQLCDVLNHVRALDDLDLTNTLPLTHPHDIHGSCAQDAESPTMTQAKVLNLAPATVGQFIRVPKVLGKGGGGA